MTFVRIEQLINLRDGYRRTFRIDHRELFLLEQSGERWLIDRRCPHAGQALDEGEVLAGTIRCPRHGLCFSLHDGRSQEAASEPLRVYDLIYEGNSIGVDDTQL